MICYWFVTGLLLVVIGFVTGLLVVCREVKESQLPRDDDEAGSSDAAASKTNGKSSAAAAASNGAAAGNSTEQKYVEVGSGELHINKFKSSDGSLCARLVLRAEKVQRLVVNAPLLKGMSFGMQQEKYVRFISLGLDEPRKMTAHLLRVCIISYHIVSYRTARNESAAD